jgi:hypothetical protein
MTDREARLKRIKEVLQMRYGRSDEACMDDMEFMMQEIERLEAAVESRCSCGV